MTKSILIGVGGSGQHVVHAYLRLLSLTSPNPGEVPHVFLIDADAKQGGAEGKQSTLVEDASNLHASLVAGDPNPSRFSLIRPYYQDDDKGQAPTLLRALLDISGGRGPDMAVAQAFLADDQGEFGSDWDVEVSQGMMANPKVGALAFGHKVLMEGRRRTVPGGKGAMIERVIDVPLNGARIAIVGSSFGGTGSGVVPALVRLLDSLPGQRLVRAYFTLPWFSLDRGNNAQRSAAQETGGVDPTLRNASLGLHTYHSELSGAEDAKYRLKQSSYILAQSMVGWAPSVRASARDFDQPEHPHVLNLIVGCAIQGFFGMGGGSLQPGVLYALKTTAQEENQGQFSPDTSPHLHFHAGPNDNRTLRDLWGDAETSAFVLDACGQRLEAVAKGVLTIDMVGEVPGLSGLDKFVLELTRMLSRPPETYGFAVWKRQTGPDTVFHELGKALRERARQLQQTLLWLDAHAPSTQAGGNAPGLKNYAPRHLFTVVAPSPLGPTRSDIESIYDVSTLRDHWADLGANAWGEKDANFEKSPIYSKAVAVLRWVLSEKIPVGASGSLSPLAQALKDLKSEESIAPAPPPLDAAARVLSRSIFSRVIQLRGANRKSAKAKDKDIIQQSADVNSAAGKPMLKFDIAGIPILDSRHLQVRLDDQSVDGNPRDGMGPDHPLSLEYLDPYNGLSQEAGERVTLAGHVFVEHGLKGIPNIIAPRLLQQWRLSQCAPQRIGNAEEIYTVRNRRLKATRAGTYLHACRVIEAAFWLAISSNREVEWVENIFAGDPDHVHSALSDLVRIELGLGLGHDGDALSALVFSSKRGADAGKPVFLWDGETWFLAANGAAREFFARLLPQLPSVRYRYRSDNALRLAQAPDETRVSKLDRFFALQIRSYYNRLEERKQALGTLEPPLARLRAALEKIASELPAPQALSGVEEGVSFSLALSGKAVEPRQFDIRQLQALRKVWDHLCDPVVLFVDKDRKPNGVLPFKAEAWAWLEGGEDANKLILDGAGISKKFDSRRLARAKVKEIRLNVRGIGEIREEWPFGELPIDVVEDEFNWAFGLWPNFHATNWNYYVISGLARIGDPETPDVESKFERRRVDVPWLNERHKAVLVVKGTTRKPQGGKLIDLGIVSGGLPLRIDGRPKILELRVGGKPLGSRVIPLEPVSLGSLNIPMMGLDFGTSNSCMAIQTVEDDASSRKSVPLLPGGALLAQSEESLFLSLSSSGVSEEVRAFQRDAANFYHVKTAAAGHAAGTLPSELHVTLDEVSGLAEKQKLQLESYYGRDAAVLIGDLGSVSIPKIKYPLVSPLLTPFPPNPLSFPEGSTEFFVWLAGLVSETEARVFDNLKWPRPGDDDSYTQSRSLRALYLEALLVVALATVRRRGFTGFKVFVATLPEALAQLESGFADTYDKDLKSVLSQLCQRTGVQWAGKEKAVSATSIEVSGPLTLVSETTAALQAAGVEVKIGDRDRAAGVMTLDIGGGTTDVGIDLIYTQESGANLPMRHTASVRFAGNRLIDSLIHVDKVRECFGGTFEDRAVASLLKASLRRDELKVRTNTTAYVATVFFDAIYEYAFNALRNFIVMHPSWLPAFLSSTPGKARRPFKVILFGNGFKLYEAFQVAGSSGASLNTYNERMKKRLVAAGMVTEDFAERIEFELKDDSKEALIRSGLNAASSGHTLSADRLAERFILLPDGVRTVDASGKPTPAQRRLGATEFEDMVKAKCSFLIDHSEDEMRLQFPLTFEHWAKSRSGEKLRDTFEKIFLEGDFGKYYRDPGAIYLAGIPKDSRSESICTLMLMLAKESQS